MLPGVHSGERRTEGKTAGPAAGAGPGNGRGTEIKWVAAERRRITEENQVPKSLCIVGGGPGGVGLAWALATDPAVAAQWDVTIIHNEAAPGGHCATHIVTNPNTGAQIPVDIGVQYVSPLINPNVSVMLEDPTFQTLAPVAPAGDLTVACGFPRVNNQPMNWGNFPAYQTGTTFALYDLPGMVDDCTAFQEFMQSLPIHPSLLTTSLQDFLDDPPSPLTDVADFTAYFIDPYMTIVNGYGAPALNSVMLADLLPLFAKLPFFDGPLGALTVPGQGWQRWTKGSSSWVAAMNTVAGQGLNLTFVPNTTVHGVWFDPSNLTGPVYVSCQPDLSDPVPYDKVVLATDMWTNASLLNNANNQAAWNSFYADALSQDRWGVLQPGTCYIHADPTILSPDLQLQQEVAQFTAYYSTQGATAPLTYNPATTFTTYLVENVHQDPQAKGLYVTMYGPPADAPKLPANPLVTENFTHGLWLPQSMQNSTKALFKAQGAGSIANGGGQLPNTGANLYFTGNNTSMDSVEGALVSSLVIANYAFGVQYPMPLTHPLTATALAMFLYIYLGLMFPVPDGAVRHALTQRLTAGLAAPA